MTFLYCLPLYPLVSTTAARRRSSRPKAPGQARLQVLLERFGCPAVSLSEPFEDGLALLRVAEERHLEGVVSKRRDASYRSGECSDWRKVKTQAWREANRERWRLFERG
jgi:hypothetical protein